MFKKTLSTACLLMFGAFASASVEDTDKLPIGTLFKYTCADAIIAFHKNDSTAENLMLSIGFLVHHTQDLISQGYDSNKVIAAIQQFTLLICKDRHETLFATTISVAAESIAKHPNSIPELNKQWDEALLDRAVNLKLHQ